MSEIAISLSCKIDDVNRIFLLQNVEDTSIQATSSISKHPIPTGEYVSDTMFKEPISIGFNGTFSINGKKGIVTPNGEEFTLKEIEDLFMKIKNAGILCTLVKVELNESNTPKFNYWESMALQSITWSEKINSLGFSFNFQQVMQVEINEYEVDESDENLPDVEDPKTLNFTDSLFNSDYIIKLLIDSLKDFSLVKDEFLTFIAEQGKGRLVSAVAGLTAVLAAVIIGGITSGGVLIAVGAIAMAGVFLYKTIKNIYKHSKSKIREFKYFKNDKKRAKEAERFGKLCKELLEEFQQFNQVISVYQISSNKPHQAILTIDDDYYCFTFTRDNTENNYGLTILDLDGNIVSGTKTILNIKEGALQSLGDCNENTAILKTSTGYQVYLINAEENRSDDLTTYYIMVSAIDMGNYSNLCTDIIKKYLLY